MDPEIHDVLMRTDSATNFEFPTDFDYSNSIRLLLAIRPLAEQILGALLELDDQVQDASFYADLGILAESIWPNGVTFLHHELQIRFSTFGKLVTISGHQSSFNPRSEPIQRLISLLTSHGFVYIDAETLFEPYDGKIESLRGQINWWGRFFDYL